MRKILMIASYVGLFTLANVNVAMFGVWVTPFNALFIIAADMVIRDRIQYDGGALVAIFASMLAGSATIAIAPDAGRIAIASSLSVVIAGLASAVAFRLRRGDFYRKSYQANVIAAAVDSIAFPVIAFGSVMVYVTLAQFAAKVIGASAILYLMKRYFNNDNSLSRLTDNGRQG